MNGQLLTRLNDNSSDPSALTPNHLLMLRAGICHPPGEFGPHDTYSKKRWRYVQHLADCFWSQWRKFYINELRERSKWLTAQENVAPGDFVLIEMQNLPRNIWPTGIVLETYPGKDGLVR